MFFIRRLLTALIVLSALFAAAKPAQAQLALMLEPDVETGAADATLLFEGDLFNQSATTPLFLNGIAFDYTGDAANYLEASDSIFITQIPDILGIAGAANDHYSGPLFTLRLSSAIPQGTYSGSVTVLGGRTPTALLPLRTAPFVVNVQGVDSAPEPAALPLFLVGGIGIVGMAGSPSRLRKRVRSLCK